MAAPPAGPRVFMFSGYQNQPQVRDMLAEKVRKLGGRVVEGITWREDITHVVTNKFDDYKETVLGALAAGKWVVTKRYIDRSHVAGAWKEESPFKAHEIVGVSREKREAEGGIFRGLKVLFLLENQLRKEVYSRLVKAGGGEVVDIWGLKKLIETQPGPEELNMVVGDCHLLSRKDVRHELFKQWIKLCQECDSLVPHVYYQYIFETITSASRQDPGQWSIFLPSTVKRAKEDGNMRGKVDIDIEGLLKRSAEREEEEEGVEIKRAKKEDATQCVSVTLPANVQTVTLEDSDDDLEVLEERLATRRQLDRGRVYREEVENYRERRLHEVVQVSGSEEESFGITDISDDEIQVLDQDEESRGHQVRIGGKPFENNQGQVEETVQDDTEPVVEHIQTGEVVAQPDGTPNQPEMGLDLSKKNHSWENNNKDKENNEAEKRKAALFQRFLQRAREVEKSTIAPSSSPTIPSSSAPSVVGTPALPPRSVPFQPPVPEMPLCLDLSTSSSASLLPQLTPDPPIVPRTEPATLPVTPCTPSTLKKADAKMAETSKGISSKKHGTSSSKRVETSSGIASKKTAAPVSVPNPRVAIPLAAPTTLPTPLVDGPNFNRVVSALQERQTKQEECLTISATAPGRLFAFDKHKEGRRIGEEKEVKQVAAYIKEEFHQFGRSGGDGAEGLQVTSYVSSLHYLKGCTTTYVLPSPSILHKLLTEHLLDQPNPCVRRETVRYLDRILLIRLGREQVMKAEEYSSWQQMVLASLVKEQQDTFDIEDKRQVAESAAFIASLMKRFKEVDQVDSGPVLLMHYLVKLLQRDFEVWWKEQRKKDNRRRPLLQYLFGGEGRILASINSSLGPLYSALLTLKRNQEDLKKGITLEAHLEEVRKLIALVAHLLAFHDAQEKQNKVVTGTKVELGNLVAAALANLTKQDQAGELALLQPSWLTLLVSRALLERKINQRVDSLSSLLSNIKLDSSPALCTLAYRTLSCNHLHSLHTATWQLQVKGNNNRLAIWKGLDKLPEGEEKKSEGRTVRWKNEVGIVRKELLKEANTLLQVSIGQKEVVAEGSTVLKALLFKRTSPTDF